ncbi:MAG TPA: ATP-binding protein, partial [Flavisolibacter sp.]|nr:ATP-binding protein [Flavisolibacter sp.]
ELHDNVNQILTTVKLYNEMYLTGYVKDISLLEKSARYTQDCINEIRSISKRLSAPMLGRISLQDSIRELIDSINLTGRLEIVYIPEGVDQCCISQDLHLTVYRIVQEALNNIIKYSQAQVACIEVRLKKGQLHLVITDNGKGFDTTAKRTGIGITNMKTRAENLQGVFRISSAPGKGCEIDISFPCENRRVQDKDTIRAGVRRSAIY